ncbi:hypothetical protein Ancab_024094 [Ancistrocladus abbreviatus]
MEAMPCVELATMPPLASEAIFRPFNCPWQDRISGTGSRTRRGKMRDKKNWGREGWSSNDCRCCGSDMGGAVL